MRSYPLHVSVSSLLLLIILLHAGCIEAIGIPTPTYTPSPTEERTRDTLCLMAVSAVFCIGVLLAAIGLIRTRRYS